MNFLIVVYLFTCANILTFIRITKEVAAGNLEPESSAKYAEKREQSLSEDEVLKDPAGNALVEELYKIYNEDEHQRRLDNTALNKIMPLADTFIENIKKIHPESRFMQGSHQELLNLCRRTWIMYLLKEKKQDIETVEKYEKLFSVNNIGKYRDPRYYEIVFYGKNKLPRGLFTIGCELQESSGNTDPFKVYIIPHKTSNSYYIVRDLTPPGSDKPVLILFGLVENVTLAKNHSFMSFIPKLCC